MDDNYEDAKVGDQLFIRYNFGHADRLATVTRLTQHRICFEDEQFYKKDGRSVGGGSWDRRFLKRITPEGMKKYNVGRVQFMANNINKLHVTPENMEEVETLINRLKEIARNVEKAHS